MEYHSRFALKSDIFPVLSAQEDWEKDLSASGEIEYQNGSGSMIDITVSEWRVLMEIAKNLTIW